MIGWLQPPEGTLVVDDDPTDDVLPEIGAPTWCSASTWTSAALRHRDPGHPGLAAADLEALPDRPRPPTLRNLLYAVEWWVFGAFAVFIWWRWRRDATNPDLAPDLPSPSAG